MSLRPYVVQDAVHQSGCEASLDIGGVELETALGGARRTPMQATVKLSH